LLPVVMVLVQWSLVLHTFLQVRTSSRTCVHAHSDDVNKCLLLVLTFSCLPIGTAEAGFCTFAVRQSCLLCPVAGPGGIVVSEAAAGGLELRPEPALEAAPDFLLAGCFCTKRTGCDSIPKNSVQAMLCCRFLLFV